MNVDEILWPQKTCIVKVTGLEEHRIKRPLMVTVRIAIAARHIGLKSKPRVKRRIHPIACVHARRPCKNGLAAKSSGLENFFRVVVKTIPVTKFSRSK